MGIYNGMDPAERKTGATRGWVAMALDAVNRAIGKVMKDYCAPWHQRIEELERQIKDLQMETIGRALHERLSAVEARPQMSYRGVWAATEEYTREQVCTLGGHMWIVRTDSTRDRPGSSSSWQMCVQRGRSGRDADGSRGGRSAGEEQ